MQTFLPYSDYARSAEVLDNKRLGKQRVECLQLLNALDLKRNGVKAAWQNHPAALMWEGFEAELQLYSQFICYEWILRGFKDTCLEKLRKFKFGLRETPSWVLSEDFTRSHQSNLIRKDAAFYGPKFPGVPADLPYVWPVRKVQ